MLCRRQLAVVAYRAVGTVGRSAFLNVYQSTGHRTEPQDGLLKSFAVLSFSGRHVGIAIAVAVAVAIVGNTGAVVF